MVIQDGNGDANERSHCIRLKVMESLFLLLFLKLSCWGAKQLLLKMNVVVVCESWSLELCESCLLKRVGKMKVFELEDEAFYICIGKKMRCTKIAKQSILLLIRNLCHREIINYCCLLQSTFINPCIPLEENKGSCKLLATLW